MRINRKSERGQTILFTLPALVVILGMCGLIFDAGWAFYQSKKAQTAADSGAMAVISAAKAELDSGKLMSCGGALECASIAPACTSGGNLQLSCEYAKRNGFVPGGNQQVQVESGLGGQPSGLSYLPDGSYWVQVQAQHEAPPWFASIFGGQGLTAMARATAAILPANAGDSIYLLNRKSDCFASALNLGVVCGEDLLMLGGNQINAEKGIWFASSNRAGLGLPMIAAATAVGAATVTAPFSNFLGNGGVQSLGLVSWSNPPTNKFADSDDFRDPMAGKGQPGAGANLPNYPVPGGILRGGLFASNPLYVPPGNYYATTIPVGTLVPAVATGTPITIIGQVVFGDGSSNPCGGFCEYIFHGGLVTASLSSVTLSPGRYVFAGAPAVAGGPGAGLSIGVNAVLKDMTPLMGNQIGAPNDAGEILVFTDSHYPTLQLPGPLANAGISLPQARAGIVTLGLGARVTLHGLNKDSPRLPAELRKFAPVLIWQDQANTAVKYSPNGTILTSCPGGCTNLLDVPGSQEMIIGASNSGLGPGTQLYGTIYGPRGSWLTITGLLPGDTVAGPLQIITGALQMTLNTRLDLRKVNSPVSTYTMAMVQ